MSPISRFEDLIAWQKARTLNKLIYQTTSIGKFNTDFGLRDQIRRASVSIMSNIAEGFERDSKVDYARFLIIAKSSCGEVRSQLYIASDIEYINMEQFKQLSSLAIEVSRVIVGLRASILRK